MALSVKEVKEIQKGKENLPLNQDEYNYLEVLEHYIDGEILKQFENSHKIKIDLSYPRLSQAIKNWGDLFREIKQYRRYKISNLIDKKYEDGGWKIGIDISDGMGMASYEYWVLTPKDDK